MAKTSNKGGRPPKYSDEATVVKIILKYFDSCTESKTLPNKAGLCIFLGISRDTYSEYRGRFPDAIKGADAYIEDAWVQRLAGNAPTGAIFYLKNAFKEHYKDRQETDVTSKGERIVFMPPEIMAKHNLNAVDTSTSGNRA